MTGTSEITLREARSNVWRTTGRPTVAVIAAIVSAAIPPFLVGALAPLMADDMRFTVTDVGVAIAAYYLVSGVLSPLGGRVVGLIGVAWSLRLSCAITSAGLVAIGLAGDAIQVTIALALLGVPNSVVQPAANAALAEVRAPRLQAVVFGTVQASIPTATLIAGVVLGLASVAGGWRGTVLGVAALALGALRLTRALPHTARPRSQAAPVDLRPRIPGRETGGPWLLASLVTMGFLASVAATSLPSYVASTGLDTGLAPGAVAAAQVLGSLACASTRIGAPLGISHGTGPQRLLLVCLLLCGGVLGYALLGVGSAPLFVIGTVLAYACGWGWNGLFNQVVVAVRPGRVAAATGLTQSGIFLGGMIGPLTFAVVVQTGGYGAAWLMSAGAACTAALVAAGAFLLLARTSRDTPS